MLLLLPALAMNAILLQTVREELRLSTFSASERMSSINQDKSDRSQAESAGRGSSQSAF